MCNQGISAQVRIDIGCWEASFYEPRTVDWAKTTTPSSAVDATMMDQSLPSLLTPTSAAATISRSFLPVTVPSVAHRNHRDISVSYRPRCASAPSAFTLPSISIPSAAVTRPPTYHTNAPVQSPRQYTTAFVQTTPEGQDVQGKESFQSFQSWLLSFPEHTIPFIFREILH